MGDLLGEYPPDAGRHVNGQHEEGLPFPPITWDPAHRSELCLLKEYLPEIRELDHARFTPVTEVADAHTVTLPSNVTSVKPC